METLKYYEDQLQSIKNDLLSEIKELIPNGVKRDFLTHLVHSCGANLGRDSDILVINGVIVNGERVMFNNYISTDCGNVAASEAVLFDERTILRVLDILREEIRKEKLDKLRELLSRNGGDLQFDGSFGFHAVVHQFPDDECVCHEKSMIKRIKLDASGAMYFCCECGGELVSEGEGHLPFNELDEIINYVKSQVCETMTLAFYKVDNSCGYERHEFDNIYDKPSEIVEKLKKLDDEEVRFYNIEVCDSSTMILNLYDLVKDYNDELLDGGWWVVLVGRPKN